jgi:hypothetical protein
MSDRRSCAGFIATEAPHEGRRYFRRRRDFEINGDSAPQLIAGTDIPLTGIKAKQRVDTIAVKNWITQHAPQHVYIERGQAMPRQSSSALASSMGVGGAPPTRGWAGPAGRRHK